MILFLVVVGLSPMTQATSLGDYMKFTICNVSNSQLLIINFYSTLMPASK